jgi:NADPH-dependent glutamate synthase beta subunit-like oxidoreductase/NAD(P)H-flavin reductase
MTATQQSNFPLGIAGFSYADLYVPERLGDLLGAFEETLRSDDAELFAEYQRFHHSKGKNLNAVQTSDLLVRTAPHVGRFIAQLFGIAEERCRQIEAIRTEFNSIFNYKREIVARVDKRYTPEDLSNWDPEKLERDLALLKRVAFPDAAAEADPERSLGVMAATLLNLREHFGQKSEGRENADARLDATVDAVRNALATHPDAREVFDDALLCMESLPFVENLLGYIARWTYAVIHGPESQDPAREWISFKKAERVNFDHLVNCEEAVRGGYVSVTIPENKRHHRDGFSLTDRRASEREVLYEVDHCIYCHERDTDSCSKGMRKKDGTLRMNPLGITLIGCPLEEKISEAHLLKRDGDNIAALALIMIDNPMVPGTGHRICNDCMKGCIYQKVEPVNIPQIETNILTDVLFTTYGFEIYSLLTRWNPLNVHRPHALPYNGKDVLVVGLGPAGYTLAHYLASEGFGVVAIDAFKIEPLPSDLAGSVDGLPKAVRDFQTLYEELDKRVMAGFGGVAEYGITVRWDKNFLKVIHLSLVRRRNFSCYGGVRFGGTLTIDDAWELGFDHIAIASGAGKPTVIKLKNNLIRGVRKASDFLMALQLTGAAKRSSLANLQVRLPAGVIGGGLTAIDTATELLAYYPMQVEKILHRYERLAAGSDEASVLSHYDEEERSILGEFLAHGREVRAERERAKAENRKPDLYPLVMKWGGVTLFYRRGMNDSPAYRQDHEEVEKALQEGIVYAPNMNPLEAIPDEYGHLRAVRFERSSYEEGESSRAKQALIPLRSLFVAAGTSPNIIYEDEHPATFELDGKFFQRHEPRWNGGSPDLLPIQDGVTPKLAKPAPFTSYVKDGKYITFFGDNHPVYAGTVVKAMASAKDGYPYIVKLFEQELSSLDPAQQVKRDAAFSALRAKLNDELIAKVVEINRLTPTIVEVVARAPMQVRQFHPGQFYRIQNLETGAPVLDETILAAEGLALTGAWVNREKGLVSLITLEMGTSSRLCALWKPGDTIIVMGPTGTPTEIPRGKNILLAGGGLGNAVLFSIGKAMRAAGNKVVYFAGYRSPDSVFKPLELQAASDVLVWAVDYAPGVQPIATVRARDKSFVGNIIEAMTAYGKGELGETPIPLQDIDHIMAIGSDSMMAAVKAARSGVLKPFLKSEHTAVGSINSSMQCMMKGVCAQCLCKHIDPKTGEESFVYSCFNQDQMLDEVDFSNLHARLRQNSVQEELSDLWLNHVLTSSHRP